MSNNRASIASHLLPLTAEEQTLLDAYEELRALEKLKDQAISKAAKARLEEANKEHLKQIALKNGVDPDIDEAAPRKKKQKKSKKPRIQEGTGMGISNDDSDQASDDGSEDSSVEEADDRSLVGREQRNDVDLQEEEEKKRAEFMRMSSDSYIDTQKIKKKARQESTSLLVNMDQGTPPHDFSKSMEMSKVTGKQLFPQATPSLSPDTAWSPPEDSTAPDEGCLELELSSFKADDVAKGNGNNTVAIKFSAPQESKRFSINIAAPDHDNYYSVLMHFNPRQFEKGGQVVLNNKISGTWGQGINIPLSTFPLMFGETSSTLIVQINGDGFDIFLDKQHCARLEHRVPLPDDAKSLMLQFPSTDDYGHTENWSVYKVWWGYKPLMAKDDLSNIPGVKMHSKLHQTKLFISKLPKIHTETQIELRRAELERAFQKYGGAHGVTVLCPANRTFAFVEVESFRAADLAMREMSDKYTVNRARMSRHEALMEERKTAGATGAGGEKETSDW